MSERLTSLGWSTLILIVLIGGWAALARVGLLDTLFGIVAFALGSTILTIDALDIALRLWRRERRRAQASAGEQVEQDQKAHPLRAQFLKPYALIASVHDASGELEAFMAAWAPFRERMWLIDDASSDGTGARLRHAGWRCIDGRPNRKKPGAIKALIASLPREIETVVVLDPDMRIDAPAGEALATLERVLFDFQRSRADAACPRIVIRGTCLLGACQALEYDFSSLLARASLGTASANSGASIYRRAALARALSRHSLSVYAEDFENSTLILSEGGSIHLEPRLVLETESMCDVRAWLSQRVGWSFGWARVYFEKWRELARIARRGPMEAYHYGVYLGLIGLAAFPVKLAGVSILAASGLNALDALLGTGFVPDTPLTEPAWCAAVYVQYLVVLTIATPAIVPRGERTRHLAIVPLYVFYAVAQVVPMAIGFMNLGSLLWLRRRVYDDHYDSDPRLQNA